MKKNLYVVKLGSNVLLSESGGVNVKVINQVVENIAELQKKGNQFIIVSSGAVAAGKEYFNHTKPEDMDDALFAQLCSSLGQPILMKKYEESFQRFGIVCSQNLFTQDNFKPGSPRESAVKVLGAALDMGVVPIVNENDVLSKDEIVFSDNDILASYVASLLGAKKVILLSNVEGLCTAHPDEGGVCITKVGKITDEHFAMVSESKSSLGQGGMKSKLEAAEFLLERGIEMHLANGHIKDIVKQVVAGQMVGTQFIQQ